MDRYVILCHDSYSTLQVNGCCVLRIHGQSTLHARHSKCTLHRRGRCSLCGVLSNGSSGELRGTITLLKNFLAEVLTNFEGREELAQTIPRSVDWPD